jgi:predicted amidohydrolase
LSKDSDSIYYNTTFWIAYPEKVCYNMGNLLTEGKLMENLTIACIQQRMSVLPTHEEFEAQARRFLRLAQAKEAKLTVFPELTGVMLAPPLISGLKLGFIKRDDRGKRPDAGLLSRSIGHVAGTTADALGGGFRGSLGRLLAKNSDSLRDAYFEMFGRLAREFGTAIVGGSLYMYDDETGTARSRAYVFDVDGEVLGYQDKLNLVPDEQAIAVPGTNLTVLHTRYGRLGLLIGYDVLYPELARMLAVQGADLLIGISAIPGAAPAKVVRSALALRAEENQVFAAASFLIGPNHLGRENREEYFGQSALLAPISLTVKGDGILTQVGTDHTEGVIASELDMEGLYDLRHTSRFRPRLEMNLGTLGSDLADFYSKGWTIEQAAEQHIPSPIELIPEPETLEPEVPVEVPEDALEPVLPVEVPEEVSEPEPEPSYPSIPEALSLTGQDEQEEQQNL